MLPFFGALITTHFIMDWLFQTSWEAANKDKKWLPLLVHSLIYTLGFIPALWFYGVSLWWLALLLASHMMLDRRVFELWWLEKIKRVNKNEVSETLWTILLFGVDQTFHLAVLAAIAIAA